MQSSSAKANSDDDLLLSLVEKSVDLIAINDCDNSLLAEKFSSPTHQSKSQSNSFKGNLHKICFQKRKLLLALKHWIHSSVGSAKCVSSDSSFDSFLNRAKGDGYCLEVVDLPSGTKPPNIAEHFQNINSETSLDVYHDGCLLQGVVVDSPMAEKHATLLCAAKMYRHLLWLRSVTGKSISHLYGFSIYCSDHNNADLITLSKLRLEIPAAGRQIGARFPFFVHSNRYLLVPTSRVSSKSFLDDLGSFVLAPHRPRPSDCVNLHSIHPGPTMLVPPKLLVMLEAQPSTASEQVRDHRIKIVPTITGSLVIRCRTVTTMIQILSASSVEDESNDDLMATIGNLRRIEKAEQVMAWYVKCKTPISFGPFWETSKIAINSTRRRLALLLEREKHSLSKQQVAVANDWLDMHAVNAILEPHRNLTITRDMGTAFRGELSWNEFATAFSSLANRTLLFQNMTNLIHGDIHGGNILLKEKKLILIDWDEASRDKPIRRITVSEEEKRQYPSALVSFPELYTKQQFLALFHFFLLEYYPRTQGEDVWKQYLAESRIPEGNRLTRTVAAQYKSLLLFLSAETSCEETKFTEGMTAMEVKT